MILGKIKISPLPCKVLNYRVGHIPGITILSFISMKWYSEIHFHRTECDFSSVFILWAKFSDGKSL